jgi:hypothetical protein
VNVHPIRSEWEQFRLLSRDSIRRLLNTALLSSDSDPIQFAIWAVAAVAIPPSMYGFSRMFEYARMGASWTPAAEAVLLSDRMFFVLYGMVAAALLAATVWEALLPDATDQEVLGALPVRPRTLAVARLSGALLVALVFAVAVSAPPALLFAGASTTHPAFGPLPMVIAAHLGAATAGCLFTFLALLILRAAVAFLFGAHASERLATCFQLAVVAGIVAALFFLPGVLQMLVGYMVASSTASSLLPPVWFAALYGTLVGSNNPALADQALRGVVGLLCAAIVVVPVYLGPAALVARRTLAHRTTHRAGMLTRRITTCLQALIRDRRVRAIVAFTVISLVRNRRHFLVVVMYAGMGVAIGASRVVAIGFLGQLSQPHAESAVLLLPLVLMMFLTAGLRTAFVIPTELEANWTFRVFPPSSRGARSATLTTLVTFAMFPALASFVLLAALLGWPLSRVLTVAAFDVAVGLCLARAALHDWAQIPFACGHAVARETVKSKWLRFLFLLFLIAFIGAQVQAAALASMVGTALYLAIAIAAAVALAVWQNRGHDSVLRFDAPDESGLETLGLSEALR